MFHSFEELGSAFGLQKVVEPTVQLPECTGCGEAFVPQFNGAGIHACADCCEDSISFAIDTAIWRNDDISREEIAAIRQQTKANLGVFSEAAV